jgi:lipoyl(octanoyl) transferase
MEWKTSSKPIEYEEAMDFMEKRMSSIKSGKADNMVWLLEHPSLYTAGTSAKPDDLLIPDRFPVYKTGRGGKYTYHGPGQRIAYMMLNLKAKKKHRNVREFVYKTEDWIIKTLENFGINGHRLDNAPGIWVTTKHDTGIETTEKIAAIGIKIKHGISYHGIAINVCPDLSHFEGIVPCGIHNHGVTSFEKLGITANMINIDAALLANFIIAFDGFV